MNTRVQTLPSSSWTRPLIAIAAISALALSLLTFVRPAEASSVNPTFVDGNPDCAAIGLSRDLAIDAGTVVSGSKTYSNANGSIEITSDAEKKTFSFDDANPPVDAVIVKAGDGANVYKYVPAVTSDTDLITPDNDGGQQAGLSHFVICFGVTPPPESPSPSPSESASPSPSVSPSVSPSASVSPSVSPSASVSPSPSPTTESSVEGSTGTPAPSPTVEQSVEAATGTPAASVPNTAIGSGSGSMQLPTILFGLLLVASLGGLLVLNVKSAIERR